MKKITLILVLLSGSITISNAQELGKYFSKKEYFPQQLPVWSEEVKAQLPIPILSDNPGLVNMYWWTWKLAIRNLRTPQSTSPFVSNYIDESFGGQIFIH